MTPQDAVPTVSGMRNLALLYVGDYQREEEETLRNQGVRTARVSDAGSFSADDFSGTCNSRFFLRSTRLSQAQYSTYWASIAAAGGFLLTSPKSFEIMNNFRLYYPAIRNWSPKAVTAPAEIGDQDLLKMIHDSGLGAPLFVRSDVESAAKYAGIESCMMQHIDLLSLSATTAALRKYVKSFREIIVKEVFQIASTNEARIEYRAIGAGGHLIVFDIKESSPLPAPNKEILDVADKALRSLAAHGADGAIFVDLALGMDGRARVVECKDFVNGTISNVKAFAHALSSLDQGCINV